MLRAGLKKSAAYVIRPDGYVGLAEPRGDRATLERYFRDHDVQTVTRPVVSVSELQ